MFSSLISSAVSVIASRLGPFTGGIAAVASILACLFGYLFFSTYSDMNAKIEILSDKNASLRGEVNTCNIKIATFASELTNSRDEIKRTIETCADNINSLTDLNKDLTKYRNKYLGSSTSECQSTSITDGTTNETTDVIIFPRAALDERRRLLRDLGMLQGTSDDGDH